MNVVASVYRRLSIRDLIATTPVYTSSADVSGEGLSLVFRRWATKKTAGSTKNGRDSLPKNLVVKKFGGEAEAEWQIGNAPYKNTYANPTFLKLG